MSPLMLLQTLAWCQQALLYVHLFAFAIAIAQVIRLDLAWLRTRDLGTSGFDAAVRIIMVSLAVLWVTGLALIGLSVGFDRQALAERPKLVAKLIVVSVLTVNGIALHALALPRLDRGRPLLAWTLGAVSSVSWTAAALIGAARHVAPVLTLTDYLAVYGTALVAALTCAWTIAGLAAPSQPLDAPDQRPSPMPASRA